jgi:serine/threonine-protein kinase RsbW
MEPKVSTFSFPSKPDSIGKVEAFVEDLKDRYDIRDDVFGNILISITEAANNAIIHGNRCDESKEVSIDVSYNVDSKVLTFKVQDQGEGFDFNNLPDPTSPENLEKITGRGVFLMKQLADWVIFADSGSQVELQFRL